MATVRLVLARHAAGDLLHCYAVDWPVRPGDALLDPDGDVALVVATEEQILGPVPPSEGQARPVPPADELPPSAAEALARVPAMPYLNTIVTIAHSAHGPARLVRIRARPRTAVLSLATGQEQELEIEVPLAQLRPAEDQPADRPAEGGSLPC